jgi:hypothetical protein
MTRHPEKRHSIPKWQIADMNIASAEHARVIFSAQLEAAGFDLKRQIISYEGMATGCLIFVQPAYES